MTRIVHDTFTLERTLDAPAARVFAAFADAETKAQWFVGPDGWQATERTIDVRVGGQEVLAGRHQSGMTSRFVARYHVISPDERIVYSYDMHVGDQLISVSLATVEVAPARAGTLLRITEQGAYLDGNPEAAASRKRGTAALMEQLVRAVAASPATR